MAAFRSLLRLGSGFVGVGVVGAGVVIILLVIPLAVMVTVARAFDAEGASDVGDANTSTSSSGVISRNGNIGRHCRVSLPCSLVSALNSAGKKNANEPYRYVPLATSRSGGGESNMYFFFT